MRHKKRKASRGALVGAYAEDINTTLLERYKAIVKAVIGRRSGIYVLKKGKKPYYIGLASSLRGRLNTHLHDKHARKWDRFTFYAIAKRKYLKDLESILIRIAEPRGNEQTGHFGKKKDVRKEIHKEILRAVTESF